MKSVRLLPVVIFAALALLVFKGIGLATNGSYVLGGVTGAVAAGAAAPGQEAQAMPGMTAADPTLSDATPTLADADPTMPTRAAAASPGHGASGTGSDHGAEPEHGALSSAEASAPSHGASESAPVAAVTAVDEHGDAVPMMQDASGTIAPLGEAGGPGSEETLLARLSERRAELDRRETELSMRIALVEAAEKRLNERTQELAALEASVAALVDQKKAAEEEGFRAVVSMYENMKARDAAKIFDTLDLQVLLKVARAMNPRKMSPILASMSAKPAEALTTAMAMAETPLPVASVGGENLARLPQIVGQ